MQMITLKEKIKGNVYQNFKFLIVFADNPTFIIDAVDSLKESKEIVETLIEIDRSRKKNNHYLIYNVRKDIFLHDRENV